MCIEKLNLNNWERGEKEPHAVEILEEMAKIFEVPLKYLLSEKEKNIIENSPIINDLLNRVSKLETQITKIMKV